MSWTYRSKMGERRNGLHLDGFINNYELLTNDNNEMLRANEVFSSEMKIFVIITLECCSFYFFEIIVM